MKTSKIITGLLLVIVAIIAIMYFHSYSNEQSRYCRHIRDYTNGRPEFYGCADCLCERGASEDCSTKEQRSKSYYDGNTENAPMHREQPWFIVMPQDQFDVSYYGDKIFDLK